MKKYFSFYGSILIALLLNIIISISYQTGAFDTNLIIGWLLPVAALAMIVISSMGVYEITALDMAFYIAKKSISSQKSIIRKCERKEGAKSLVKREATEKKLEGSQFDYWLMRNLKMGRKLFFRLFASFMLTMLALFLAFSSDNLSSFQSTANIKSFLLCHLSVTIVFCIHWAFYWRKYFFESEAGVISYLTQKDFSRDDAIGFVLKLKNEGFFISK